MNKKITRFAFASKCGNPAKAASAVPEGCNNSANAAPPKPYPLRANHCRRVQFRTSPEPEHSEFDLENGIVIKV
jgi:hypothetical protein